MNDVVEKVLAFPAEPKVVNAIKGPRGDLDRWNMARFLWAKYQLRRNPGRELKNFAPWEASYLETNPTFSKAQAEANGQDGGFLAPEEWSRDFSDIIRDASALRANTDINYVTTAFRLRDIPVGNSEFTWNYLTENANLSSTNYTTRKFSNRTASMRKAVAIQQFSKELFEDASDIADAFLRRSIAEGVAYEQDSKTLAGTGQGGTPIGVANATNVGLSVVNATPTLAQFGNAINAAKALNFSTNVPSGSTVNVIGVAHPRVEFTIRSIVNLANQGTMPWLFGLGVDPIQQFLGVKWVLTASVPINLGGAGNQSLVLFGNWKHVWVIQRNDLMFDIGNPVASRSPITGTMGVIASAQPDFASALIDVKVVVRYDVVVTHPEAFNVMTQVNA